MAGQGRKPVTAPGRTRETLWAEIRRLRRFTVSAICSTTGELDAAYRYLQALAAGGYVQVIDREQRPDGKYGSYRYELIKDAGIEAPRLRADGSPVTQGMAREQLWRSMRILREFNVLELRGASDTAHVPVSRDGAEAYITHLKRAGYLTCVRPARPGVLARYRLLYSRNSGPKPPQVQANGAIYDPNLRRVVWSRPGPQTQGDADD